MKSAMSSLPLSLYSGIPNEKPLLPNTYRRTNNKQQKRKEQKTQIKR